MDLQTLQSQRILFTLAGMETVTALRDLPYPAAGEPQGQMDVYLPPAELRGKRHPVICFIHGGPIPSDVPLPAKEWGVYQSYGQLVATAGFIGVTFNHRYPQPAALELAAGDIRSALKTVRGLADSLPLAADRICLWACSGGGQFLSLAYREELAFVRCLVGYYPIMSPRCYNQWHPGSVPEELVAPFTLASYLRPGMAYTRPLLLARAGQDRPEINETVDQCVEAALQANMPLDVLNHPSGQHAFELHDDHPRTRDILARTLSFIRHAMGEAG